MGVGAKLPQVLVHDGSPLATDPDFLEGVWGECAAGRADPRVGDYAVCVDLLTQINIRLVCHRQAAEMDPNNTMYLYDVGCLEGMLKYILSGDEDTRPEPGDPRGVCRVDARSTLVN